jgi:ABC-type lipoprotein export system ATPase subunit
MSREQMTVKTVYGDTVIIDREHYESGRTQIPMFTKNGKMRLCDYYEIMGWSGKGKSTTLHRDNIAEVIK